ncbi:MAG: amidohydrolase family protein [Actinomycetota bacterium]|jgi:imidazolonepropionase-like amidohydrolase|nr:amidohydrolase family protein [Actinomycetota bacterium]
MRTLLQQATVIDGTGADPSIADLVVEDGRIADIGSGLDGDVAVDLTGRWLLPGIIDCHTHVMASSINLMTVVNTPFSLQFYLGAQNLARTLAGGVTSVRDAGGADLGVKAAVEQGLIIGPRLSITVSVLSQTGGHGDDWMICGGTVPFLFVPHPGRPDGVCDGPEGVLRKVREVIRAGADFVKVCSTGGVLSAHDNPQASQFLPAELEVIVAEAQASRVSVMAHAQGTHGIANAVRAGVRSIEHGIYLDDEVIEMMLEAGTFLVPTLVAPVGVLDAPEGVSPSSLSKAREVVDIHRDSIRRAAEAGVRIAMGTDSGVIPHGRNTTELVQMGLVGMAPMAVIEASTRVAAECLGVSDHLGTLQVGKEADCISLATDPLADLGVFADPANLTHVWLRGELVAGSSLAEPA